VRPRSPAGFGRLVVLIPAVLSAAGCTRRGGPSGRIRAMAQRLLGRLHVGSLAVPDLERWLLDRAAKREPQRPRAPARAKIHGVQPRRRQLPGLPTGEERDPWHRGGNDSQQTRERGISHLLRGWPLGTARAGQHHVGLEDHRLERHPLGVQAGEHRAEHLFGDLAAARHRVSPSISTSGSTIGTSPASWRARRSAPARRHWPRRTAAG
jgi:hypothetical protein